MLGFVSTSQTRNSDPDTVSALARNAVTTIQSVSGSRAFQDRLKAVGIVTGSRIKVLRAGCPVVVHSEGGRFCLRKEDASLIRVTPVASEAGA